MIKGFQHIGLGVSDIERSSAFYRKTLGFRLKINDHEEEMHQMVPVIGELCRMRVIMAINLSGGAAIELVQHTGSKPLPLPEARWGDIGFLAMGVKAYRLDEVVRILKERGADFVTPIMDVEAGGGETWRSAFIRDPDGLPVELLETAELRKAGGKPRTGGFSHVAIGVSDMEKAVPFYRDILGYDSMVFDRDEHPEGLEEVTGGVRHRSVMLKRSRVPRGGLPVEGGMVMLVQARGLEVKPLFEGRRWGDVGIMEMALDVERIHQAYAEAVKGGAAEFCEPTYMDMGSGSVGYFSYVKDPDGNTVELVEVLKLGFLPPALIAPLLSGALKIRARL